jgi:hypothetical protein
VNDAVKIWSTGDVDGVVRTYAWRPPRNPNIVEVVIDGEVFEMDRARAKRLAKCIADAAAEPIEAVRRASARTP